MTKIVGIIQPFDVMQTIYVYEDGNKKTSAPCNINDLAEHIVKLAAEHHVSEVDLHGSVQYNKGLAALIDVKRATEYEDLDFKINII